MTGEIAVEILHVTLLVVFSDGFGYPVVHYYRKIFFFWGIRGVIIDQRDELKLIDLILGK